jgi:hypothetical protein
MTRHKLTLSQVLQTLHPPFPRPRRSQPTKTEKAPMGRIRLRRRYPRPDGTVIMGLRTGTEVEGCSESTVRVANSGGGRSAC